MGLKKKFSLVADETGFAVNALPRLLVYPVCEVLGIVQAARMNRLGAVLAEDKIFIFLMTEITIHADARALAHRATATDGRNIGCSPRRPYS